MHFFVRRFKWGIGRLIFESPVVPLVVPIVHLGMDQVLPNEPPYMLKTKKKVTLYYGEPIDFSEMLADLRKSNADEVEARKAITDRIQDELFRYNRIKFYLHKCSLCLAFQNRDGNVYALHFQIEDGHRRTSRTTLT